MNRRKNIDKSHALRKNVIRKAISCKINQKIFNVLIAVQINTIIKYFFLMTSLYQVQKQHVNTIFVLYLQLKG